MHTQYFHEILKTSGDTINKRAREIYLVKKRGDYRSQKGWCVYQVAHVGALLLCCRLVEMSFHLLPLEVRGFSLEGQLFVSLFWHKNQSGIRRNMGFQIQH